MILESGNGVEFAVDDIDYNLVSKYKWSAYQTRGLWYVVAYQREIRRPLYLHRLITSAETGMDVDHIDHDGLNNTRANLRVCEHRLNLANQRKQSDRSSIYKGVCFVKNRAHQRKPWMAQIKASGKHRNLGYYESEAGAAMAYNKAAQESFGEFALLNEVT